MWFLGLINLKLETKQTKNTKLSNFHSFYAVFAQFWTDFVDWIVEKGQQGTSLLSSRLFRRVNCGIQVKHFKLAPSLTKNPKFSSF